MKDSIVIEIAQISYEISFPTVGQFIQIETRKNLISQSVYEDLRKSNDTDTIIAKIIIDTIATFEVLCPQLFQNLNKSWKGLSLIEMKPLMDAYIKVYYPFYSSWMKKFDEL